MSLSMAISATGVLPAQIGLLVLVLVIQGLSFVLWNKL